MSAEDQGVRQYRFLLRTAPVDALQAAHHEALGALAEDERARILTAVREGLVAGGRLTTDDTADIARLVALGEHRDPGAFLAACDPAALRRLAEAVVGSDAVFGLFRGYADWDGAEPEPPDLGTHEDRWLGPKEGQYAGEIKAVAGAFLQRDVSSGGV